LRVWTRTLSCPFRTAVYNRPAGADIRRIPRSSGHRILDAAAVRIVKLAAPFAPLSADIRKDTDILVITRTWTFTSSEKLESE